MKNSITVQNLKCGGCANTITKNLSNFESIREVQVDVESSTVSFESADTEEISRVKEKLKSLGYPSLEDDNSLTSKAKSFVSCATGKMSS
ncbi:heavy-metal-associated domain-containing protein [Aequorivita xiaoshiensis]|uniref:Heavy-metal-associated domain-containing protein n=1 Tax=Aequorivita xiaoshiensis TaxID=2874476 RepID=A0A9X1U3R2_9FLAO|nr:heavy metal-associated domain-containing protein [Aequorivita xiaoshiensis]MCG2431084.1 heavy-metal-associated domain-containing protein [Aequorivita xiaoshiensis]